MEEYYSKSNIAGRAWQLPAGSQWSIFSITKIYTTKRTTKTCGS